VTAESLLHDLTRRGVVLSADGDQLNVDAPDELITDELLATLKERKAELLELLAVERCPICSAEVKEQSGKHYRHVWCPTPGHFDSWRALVGRRLGDTDAPIVASLKLATLEDAVDVTYEW
jgi:hypothetical protein